MLPTIHGVPSLWIPGASGCQDECFVSSPDVGQHRKSCCILPQKTLQTHLPGYRLAIRGPAEGRHLFRWPSWPHPTSTPSCGSALPLNPYPLPRISPEDRAHTHCVRSSWRQPALPWAQGSITKCLLNWRGSTTPLGEIRLREKPGAPHLTPI